MEDNKVLQPSHMQENLQYDDMGFNYTNKIISDLIHNKLLADLEYKI